MAVVLFLLAVQFAQVDAGELRVMAFDESGAALVGVTVTIESDASQTRRALVTNGSGQATAARLPLGSYRVTAALAGFTTSTAIVDVRTALPTEYRVTLTVAPLVIADTVSLPLLDPRQTTTVQRLGAETIQRRAASMPGRALPDLINTQPGWLLEAGGTVHPRGSENQTQYVVDGLPLTDNRSPGFAPGLDADAVQSLGIITGGYPAEYGRKLGGVIEVATIGEPPRGFHGDASVGGGSFGTLAADGTAGYTWDRASLVGVAGASATDRYLDPPVEENYANHGRGGHAGAHVERGAFGAMVSHAATRFMVPNETTQEIAGQRQQRTSDETAVKLSFQRVLSATRLISVNGMVRDLGAGLTSNDAATPIYAAQQRGLRDGYVKATVTWTSGMHEWKAGGDTSLGRLREQFAYHITDPSSFEPGILPSFAFSGRATDREHALFVQDRISAGAWTIKAGLRWDSYHLLVDENGFSPRLAVAWAPRHGLTLRGSYDRAFQTPATENLLLASSASVDTLAPAVVRLPVAPSRGNFFEAAASQTLFGRMRLDASWFTRRMDDFADDDLLLNTGVSFPIAFAGGLVHGAELKVDVPSGRRFSGFVSYSWMRGEAELPVTGGLFLGDEVDLGTPGERVTITQDQRHTLRGRIVAQFAPSVWGALGGAFDSGLPFEDAGEVAVEDVPPRVIDRVDFESGRVKPSFALDASAGWTIVRRRGAKVELQAHVRNLTNELRVINFAGVFSGTALAPPRAFVASMRLSF